MSAEEIIKNESEKIVAKTKEKMAQEGGTMTEKEEIYFRMGIAYGVIISGLALTNIDANELVFKGE